MKTAERAFALYVEFKRRQHARVLARATEYRARGAVHADYLAQAATIRDVLAKDLANH
jgi:hypothetical protein